eukprot:1114819-Rhodomonas_salina.2
MLRTEIGCSAPLPPLPSSLSLPSLPPSPSSSPPQDDPDVCPGVSSVMTQVWRPSRLRVLCDVRPTGGLAEGTGVPSKTRDLPGCDARRGSDCACGGCRK